MGWRKYEEVIFEEDTNEKEERQTHSLQGEATNKGRNEFGLLKEEKASVAGI